MFDFHKLNVYQQTKALNKKILSFLSTAKVDTYIKDQLKRASLSIGINIAEGSGRFSKADKRNFYTIARGSVYECVSLLEILKDMNLIEEIQYNSFYTEYESISKMLLGLINSQK